MLTIKINGNPSHFQQQNGYVRISLTQNNGFGLKDGVIIFNSSGGKNTLNSIGDGVAITSNVVRLNTSVSRKQSGDPLESNEGVNTQQLLSEIMASHDGGGNT